MNRKKRQRDIPTRAEYAKMVRQLTERMDYLIDAANGWVDENKRMERQIQVLQYEALSKDARLTAYLKQITDFSSMQLPQPIVMAKN